MSNPRSLDTDADTEPDDESTVRYGGCSLDRRQLLRAAAASAVGSGLAGCAGSGTDSGAATGTSTSKAGATPTPTSTATPTPTPTLDATVPNCDSYEKLSQKDVNGGVTLSAGCYRINDEYVVDSGTLTLSAGVLIEFGKDAGLQVKKGGSLVAKGSLEEPVFLVGRKAKRGHWKGLGFTGDGTNANRLENTVLAHAGGHLWTGDWATHAAVFVTGATVDVRNAVLRDNEGKGLMARQSKAELTISETRFESNEKPLRIHADHVRGFAPSNTVENNGLDRVLVAGRGSSDKVLTDGAWNDPGVPFLFRQDTSVVAHLTVNAGTTVEFGKKIGIDVDGGQLTVDGTAEEPVRFRGEKRGRGAWQGIRFRNTTADNVLDRAVVEDAGGELWHGAGYSKAGVFVQGNDVTVRLANSTFANNAVCGVTATGSNYDFTVESCKFTGNVEPLRVSADLLKNVAANNSYSSNDGSYVRVGISGANSPVLRNQTWPKRDVPYRLDRDLFVKADLEIGPGATVEAGKQRSSERISVWVPFDQGGSLAAVGKDDDPVVFTGVREEAGYWGGIHFASTNSKNRLYNAVVEYAGGELRNGDLESKACVTAWEWDETPMVTLDKTTLRASGRHGIYMKCDGKVTCGNVQYEKIGGTEIWNASKDEPASSCNPQC